MTISLSYTGQGNHWNRYQKAKRLFWNPSDISFEKDQQDWNGLTDMERLAAVRTCQFFLSGECVVASDLAPLLLALRADPKRGAECAFLATQIMDEVIHVEFFTRWIQEVAGIAATGECISDRHRRFFVEVLPAALDKVLTDHSEEAIVEAISTYHFLGEAVIAETGYRGFSSSFAERKLFPGLLQGIRLVQRDEARHVAFGLEMLRDITGHNPAARERFREVTTGNVSTIVGMFRDYFEPFGLVSPFGLTRAATVSYAVSHYTKRVDDVLGGLAETPARHDAASEPALTA